MWRSLMRCKFQRYLIGGGFALKQTAQARLKWIDLLLPFLFEGCAKLTGFVIRHALFLRSAW